ncbi:hypothetical protein PGTUg99_018922 [Puccinia graminis f. sp. tritici]|uniref:Uncharacterized protein n=1 Tax=Puccinia graminis f. sp. tritici TaxID=56615 RepID=A0A5B0SJK9_PUCGR|nr:hypothetical protein PGTUg99_018922 [Puccinia graminis f. sp. tritici]
MPTNIASGSWCTINLIQPTTGAANQAETTRTACQEYKHETSTDPKTGAIQEIVTIESQNASPFEIALNVKPTTYSSIHQATTNNESLSTPTNPTQSLVPEDCVFNFYLDGISIAEGPQSKTTRNFPWRIDRVLVAEGISRKLQFATVNLVDPDDYTNNNNNNDQKKMCEDEKVIKSLGTIQIDVTRCTTVQKPRIPLSNRPSSTVTTNEMNFSERSKKACLATTAGLAQPSVDPIPTPKMEWYVQTREPQPFLQVGWFPPSA